MKKYYKYIAMFTAVVMFNCEHDDSTSLSDYVGFELGPTKVIVEQDQSSTLEIMVYASEVSGQDRTYTVEADADATTLTSPYSFSTVTIPANTNEGSFTVTITDDETMNYYEADKSLYVNFTGVEGLDFSTGYLITVAEACPNIYATISITTDDWPEETSWDLYDLSGTPTVIFSGGTYDGLANTTIDTEVCLLAGSYGIAVLDSYGDGGSTYTVTSGSTVYVEPVTLTSSSSSSTFTVD
ncbi:hypothetical protein [Winogradskyella psychrotolerans]|uniref:hypothetical protein n=1 Tax=Winogradskyella psychrotolerans TaxID=1344585 RepID=UPI001C06DC0E|nr:hypothetical protein [Winogradskyella psychrotolerans]MBU2929269.1 hypothetical protein [Winogradskyella psychrotolerans]